MVDTHDEQKILAAKIRIVRRIFVVMVTIAVWGVCGFVAWRITANREAHQEIFAASQPYDLTKVPVPIFPDLGKATSVGERGVTMYAVDLQRVSSKPGLSQSAIPGAQMQMRAYLPAGKHADRSLPCVLIAPAGTPLIWGKDLDDDNDHDEALPYAEAGIVAIIFSLDGSVFGKTSVAEIEKGFRQFRDADAGLVNARNALEFALAKIPTVDPQKIFTAGYSSAGALSLLFAAHEPRLRGCISFAGSTDHVKRLSSAITPEVRDHLPGIESFIRRSSPLTHASRIHCPTFLFQAEDDDNTHLADTKAFGNEVQRINPSLKLETVPQGGHSQEMLREGRRRAIEWMKQ